MKKSKCYYPYLLLILSFIFRIFVIQIIYSNNNDDDDSLVLIANALYCPSLSRTKQSLVVVVRTTGSSSFSSSLLLSASTEGVDSGSGRSNVVARCHTKHKYKNVKPIDPTGWEDGRFPAKEHCSKCGLCETSFVTAVKDSCAFLGPSMARIDDVEARVHGRQRQRPKSKSKLKILPGRNKNDTNEHDDNTNINSNDEARFGVLHEPIWLAKGNGIPNSQWTGVVTGICVAMLESDKVDAVVCIANNDSNNINNNDNATTTNDFASPEPILARTTLDIMRGRGVKPALAPSLRVLDEIQKDTSITRLLFCGVGCAVQAFRAVQSQLGLDEVYVIGTNCADNSPTPKAAQNFLVDGVGIDPKILDTIQGYEFMQDFQVHVKSTTTPTAGNTATTSVTKKPYFTLPGTIAEPSIAKSCRKCFDYTNGLADLVVGYMGAPLYDGQSMTESFQTVTVRNERGFQMKQIAQQMNKLIIHGPAAAVAGRGGGSQQSVVAERFASATVSSDAIVMSLIDELPPEKGMPLWIGQIMAYGMKSVGPKGLDFAQYSIDYHILRNYLYTLDTERGNTDRVRMKLPQNANDIVNYYEQNDPSFATLVSKIRNKYII